MPVISVIMGAYNCEKQKNLLYRSVESILNQTINDLEFIICDDGSTDDTYNILKSIEKKDPRIVVIQNEKNSGLAASLNNCFRNARGEYIARQDADDYSVNDRFEKQMKFMKENPDYDFVGSNCYLYNGKNIYGDLIKKEKPSKHDLIADVCFLHPTILFRKTMLDRVNGYRAVKETRRCEDYDLFMRVYALGMKGYNIQQPLLHYYSNQEEYFRRRKFKYYFELSSVLFKGNLAMGTMFPKGFIYSIKPLISAFIPSKVMWMLRKNFIKNN
jgi:glycosyltransferase involved in cell wall biosynthesis